MLIAAKNDTNVDFSRVGLFLAQEVVDSRLNVVAQTSGWKTFSCVLVISAF